MNKTVRQPHGLCQMTWQLVQKSHHATGLPGQPCVFKAILWLSELTFYNLSLFKDIEELHFNLSCEFKVELSQ